MRAGAAALLKVCEAFVKLLRTAADIEVFLPRQKRESSSSSKLLQVPLLVFLLLRTALNPPTFLRFHGRTQ